MTEEQFELIARLLRSREPVKGAARSVLIDGLGNAQAAELTGVSRQSISNTVTRFRNEDAAIQQVYNK